MGLYIKNMQKPKKGEVIAFDGENAVYTDDDMQVHRYPLEEVDDIAFGLYKAYMDGIVGERRTDG